jgi:hypothetical protein
VLLSVFFRHSTDCKHAADRAFRRCNCPKWIGGQVNREYFRKSAGTRQWNQAEEYRLKLKEALAKPLHPLGSTLPAEPALGCRLAQAQPAFHNAFRKFLSTEYRQSSMMVVVHSIS